MRTISPFAQRLCALLAVLLLLAGPAAAFDIAKDGQPSVVIAVPKNATPSAAFAAGQLAEYLEKMTGGKFTVWRKGSLPNRAKIVVGTPYKSKRPEEICIRMKDMNTLEVTGEGTRGPLYAAYRLLEHLGCGFWSPDNETVPSKRDVKLPGTFKLVEAPAFEYRQPLGTSSYDRVWRAKAAVNGDMWMLWCEATEELGWSYQMDMGESMAGVNGRDREALCEQRPEWFAWREAEKRRNPMQLCLSNQEVVGEIVRRVRVQMAKKPDTRFISVSMMDDDRFCQCEECKKGEQKLGGLVGLVVNVVNQVARDVAGDYPDLKIFYLAYWTPRPPRGLALEPNVAVGCGRLGRDYCKSAAADRGYWRDMVDWCKACHGNLYTWDYNCNFRSMLTPAPTIDSMGPTFRDYRKAGLKGVMAQMAMNPLADFTGLRCWLFAKLAWNPDQDEWALIDQWCDGACGAGAPMVKEWLRYSKKCVTSKGKGFGPYVKDLRPYFLPAEVFKGYDLFQQALAATKGDPRTSRQIRQLYTSIVVLMLTRYNFDIAAAAREQGVEIPSRAELLRAYEDAVGEFKPADWQTFAEGTSMPAFLNAIRSGEWL